MNSPGSPPHGFDAAVIRREDDHLNRWPLAREIYGMASNLTPTQAAICAPVADLMRYLPGTHECADRPIKSPHRGRGH